jgi:hypothetical protein
MENQMKLLLCFLLFGSFSSFANTTDIRLECFHKSEDNWPMTNSPEIDLEINKNGSIISGEHYNLKGFGKDFNSGETILFIPLGDFESGRYSLSNQNYHIAFMKNELKGLKMSQTIEGVVTSNVYLGYYEEDITCKRIEVL